MTTITVNEQSTGYITLGTFSLDANSKVVIRTDATNGYVIADCVTFTPAAGSSAVVIDNTSPQATRRGYVVPQHLQPRLLYRLQLPDRRQHRQGDQQRDIPRRAWPPEPTRSFLTASGQRTGPPMCPSTSTPPAARLSPSPSMNRLTATSSLGYFTLDANSKVVIRTDGTNGYVIADAIEFFCWGEARRGGSRSFGSTRSLWHKYRHISEATAQL